MFAIWDVIWTDVWIVRCRKFQFPSSSPPFRHSAIVVMLLYIFGFSAFAGLTSGLDHLVLGNPAVMLLFIPIIFGAWYGRSRLRQDTIDVDKELIFEEKQPTAFEVLDLSHWS